MKGVVKSVVADKGYGFIVTIDRTEYFFHKSDFTGHWQDLVDDRHNGQIEVEFDVTKSPKGPRAANVRRINEITG
jgi:cold shock CspA family protein